MSIIVYETENGVATAYLAPGVNAAEEAARIVPAGKAYVVKNANELPGGQYRDAWKIEEGEVVVDAGKKETIDVAAVQQARRGAYPAIGDQLDAIWKELAARRAAGDTLCDEADHLLDNVLQVKDDNPKPGEE